MVRSRYVPAPVYTWAFVSSKPIVGGEQVAYTTRLNQDMTLSCNCPGWVFSKGSPVPWNRKEGKRCKHTTSPEVQGSIPEILRILRSGGKLPTLTRDDRGYREAPEAPVVPDQDPTTSFFGRMVDLS